MDECEMSSRLESGPNCGSPLVAVVLLGLVSAGPTRLSGELWIPACVVSWVVVGCMTKVPRCEPEDSELDDQLRGERRGRGGESSSCYLSSSENCLKWLGPRMKIPFLPIYISIILESGSAGFEWD